MGLGLGSGVGKPAVNEPAGGWIERCGLWGFDGVGHCGCVPAEGLAGRIIGFFPPGVAILAAFELVEAAVWPQRLAELGILSERSGSRWRTSEEDGNRVGAGVIGPSQEVSMVGVVGR